MHRSFYYFYGSQFPHFPGASDGILAIPTRALLKMWYQNIRSGQTGKVSVCSENWVHRSLGFTSPRAWRATAWCWSDRQKSATRCSRH